MSASAPEAVLRAASAHVGAITSCERLAGLSGATVVEVRGEAGVVVAKGDPHPRERAFYEHVHLTGVPVPHLLAVVEDEPAWLLLEHVPEELPPARWGADPDVVRTLQRLHAQPHGVLDPVEEPFRPRWDEAMTAAATEALHLSDRTARRLEDLRRAAQVLFEPAVVVSGDTNPRNWCVRGDEVVLLDWERIGLAHPAIDLAVALPGFPSRDEAAQMVASYGSCEVEAEHLVGAKAWSVVEFAAESGRAPHRIEMLPALATALTRWVDAWS